MDCINYCNLVDLGYKGNKYTWTNKRKLGSNILEWLDRLLANYDWLNLFSETLVRHLPRTHSDHSPLLLTLQSSRVTKSPIFYLETMWTAHLDFIIILRDSWHPSPPLVMQSRSLSIILITRINTPLVTSFIENVTYSPD